jgi:hypothetical protein
VMFRMDVFNFLLRISSSGTSEYLALKKQGCSQHAKLLEQNL